MPLFLCFSKYYYTLKPAIFLVLEAFLPLIFQQLTAALGRHRSLATVSPKPQLPWLALVQLSDSCKPLNRSQAGAMRICSIRRKALLPEHPVRDRHSSFIRTNTCQVSFTRANSSMSKEDDLKLTSKILRRSYLHQLPHV
jgi:hypothetical protein